MRSKRFLIFILLFSTAIILLVECVEKKSTGEQNALIQNMDTTPNQMEAFNQLSEKDVEEGWELLFNGYSLEGWRGFNRESIDNVWKVSDGNLISMGSGGDIGGDIITEEEYSNFELMLEWKLSPGGNSGIFYRITEGGYPAIYATGPEYQFIDDLGYPDPLNDLNTTGANYGMHSPLNAKIKPAGEWNSSRIIVENDHVEHWLNGFKVVEYTLWDIEWKNLVAQGKWKDYPDYGKAIKGHIGLQDHGSMTWFRNIKIRILK